MRWCGAIGGLGRGYTVESCSSPANALLPSPVLFFDMVVHQRTVQSVEITLDVIEYLREQGGAGVTEIADALGRSKGTIHGHVATLVEHEHVVKRDGEYHLSLYYLDLGEAVKSRLSVYGVVEEKLADLGAASGEVAQFAVEEYGRVVYVDKVEGDDAVRTASSPGTREYMHCTALGKAMLAQMPDARVEQIVDRHGLPRYTRHTITNQEELFEELSAIRECGYARDHEELIDGVRCVACAVTHDDQVLGAISVSGPARRLEGDVFDEELPRIVQRSANVIEIDAQFS